LEERVEQVRYQIRFDWGAAGAAAITSGTDVVIWVDEFGNDSADELLLAVPDVAVVVAATLSSSRAAADWVLDRQRDLGRPVLVAIIAAGSRRADGGYRFAVEDQLAAGAIIAELGKLGLDATSPEAAAAEASFRGLERGVKHLLSASVSGASGSSSVSRDEVEVLRTPR
jgi:2-phosphosulfolactate phosphatase